MWHHANSRYFCPRCQAFWRDAISAAQVPSTIASCEDIRWTRQQVVLHHSLHDLKIASDLGCIICRTILYSPTTYERNALLNDGDETLDVVLELNPDPGPHPVLASWILESSTRDTNKTTRLPRRILAACGGLLTDEELASTLRRCVQQDNSSTGSDAALELASFWLKRCLSNHERCQLPLSTTKRNFLPTRLLDLEGDEIRLIETSTAICNQDAECRYIALSHCWGKAPIIQTLAANFNHHLQNISLSSLSRTFRDAVHATRMLGLRYLWIDSLCIIQDNDADWQFESGTMCDVYRNASLTLVAAHAAGSGVGCFEDRDGLLQFPFIVDVPGKSVGVYKSKSIAQILFTSYGRSKGLGDMDPPIYGRAWVLQEQLLSPRMLIFDGPQLRWECLSTHGSERSPLGGMSRQIGHMQTVRNGIVDDKEFFSLANFDDHDFAARIQHQSWLYVVMDYTHRGMTKPSDRLVAIDGIAQALNRRSNDTYLAGLWMRHLFVGLLWSISHEQEFTTTAPRAFDVEGNERIRHNESLAPSWSWVSVTTPVVYPVPANIFIQRICSIISAGISGNPAAQMDSVRIRAHARLGHVKPIYPYAIREAAASAPHMTYSKPTGSKGAINFRGRAFHPNDYFIFAPDLPQRANRIKSRALSWRLVRGTFRPDELIDPSTPITFIAIAQQNTGQKQGSLLTTHEANDPLQTYTLALVPTGNTEGEYRRVGFAIWEDCAWYGYMCGRRSRPGRDIEKSKGGVHGIFASMSGNLEHLTWEDALRKEEDLRHPKQMHEFDKEHLPDLNVYQKGAGVHDTELVIV